MAINLPKTVLIHEAIAAATEEVFTTAEKDKLAGIETGAEVQRGVAVFVQTEEPANPQLNDIWIQI